MSLNDLPEPSDGDHVMGLSHLSRMNSTRAKNNQESSSDKVRWLQRGLTISGGDPGHHYHRLISIKTEVALEPCTQFIGSGNE